MACSASTMRNRRVHMAVFGRGANSGSVTSPRCKIPWISWRTVASASGQSIATANPHMRRSPLEVVHEAGLIEHRGDLHARLQPGLQREDLGADFFARHAFDLVEKAPERRVLLL